MAILPNNKTELSFNNRLPTVCYCDEFSILGKLMSLGKGWGGEFERVVLRLLYMHVVSQAMGLARETNMHVRVKLI